MPASGGEDSMQPIIGTDGAAYIMETIANIGFIYSKCNLSRIGLIRQPVTLYTSSPRCPDNCHIAKTCN
jgi:hypothetical protein